MKKKVLLLSILAAGVYLMLTSYQNGPAAGGAGNRATGAISMSTTGNCGGSGCHTSNNNDLFVTVEVLDANNDPVTEYTPGTTYTVEVTGSYFGTQNLTHFGFQAFAYYGNNVQAGTFSIPSGSSSIMHLRTTGNAQVIEHSAPIQASGSNFNVTFNWTAPAAGTGMIGIIAALNAVNHDGTPNGDCANVGIGGMPEATTSVASVNNSNIKLQAYPNPVTDVLHIDLSNAPDGAYTVNVFDMAGRLCYNNTVNINANTYNTTINTRDWKVGVYNVQITGGGEQRTLPVIKF